MSEPEKPSQSAVFEQLTRRRGGTSARGLAILLGILSGGGCVCVYVVSLLMLDSTFRDIGLFLFPLPLVSLMVALVSPFAAATITAIGTARDADPDMLQLLRLTNVSPRDIVSGYVKAALYRLRLLWAICYGLLPPLWGAILVILVPSRDYSTPFDLHEYAGTAFWIVFCGAALGTGLNWLAVCVGVSAALRWRTVGHAASAAVGAVLAAYLVLGAALYCGFMTAFSVPDSAGFRFAVVCVIAAGLYAIAGYNSLESARVKL